MVQVLRGLESEPVFRLAQYCCERAVAFETVKLRRNRNEAGDHGEAGLRDDVNVIATRIRHCFAAVPR